LTVLGLGGPREPAVDRLAGQLDRPRHDDLRKLLIDHPAAYLLLACRESPDPADLRTAAEQQTTLVTLEPIAADLPTLAALGWPASPRGRQSSPPPRLAFMPAFLETPGPRHAADLVQGPGQRRLVSFTSFGRGDQGSLLARLMDGWGAVLDFAAMPESVDASLTGPDGVPEDPRQASGRLAVHARMPDGAATVLVVSDTAGQARRQFEVIGDEAQLTLDASSYMLHHPDGRVLDSHEEDDETGNGIEPLPSGGLASGGVAARGAEPYVALIAGQWRHLMDGPRRPMPRQAPYAPARVLACCQACLLSARTGQPENPRKLLEIHR
jgi:hypothetical protein